ncbi:Uncharacterized protein MJ0754 [hydrothermal vent metagenome]|uniref:Uncharacterized protein MJ0754 n=1 Tax=hydrothermal vent metagenome TaxID=652676 RepID=A0A3B1EA98_9ZZZZ
MNKTIKLSIVAILSAGLFIGCGSSESNGLSSSSDSTQQNGASTGYFIDAAVEGAHYKTTSGVEGDTDEFGRFLYNTGDEVELSLGKIILGKVQPGTDGKITPKTLIANYEVPDNNKSASIILMLRFLQSLDSDNNATNGITIDQDTLGKLSRLSTKVHFKTHVDEDYLIKLDDKYDLDLDEDYDGYLDIDAAKAKNHFQNSEDKFDNGHRPDENETNENYQGNRNGQGNGDGQGNRNRNGQGNGDGQGNRNRNGQGNGDGQGNRNRNGQGNENHQGNRNQLNLGDYNTTSNLSIDIKKSLAYMGNEERLAYDVYNALGNTYTDVKQFKNIASKSEIKHIQAVQALIQRYDINGTELSDGNFTSLNYQDTNISDMTAGVYGVVAVQDLYDTLIAEGNSSKINALKVGCKVEVTDINDLNKYITQANDANASDVKATFEFLRNGSYKHYWAFDKALKNEGITTGCYYEDDTLLTNKESIYPKN